MKKIARRTLLIAAALAFAGAAQAQDYPSRPIKWIVPYLPGTAPDITVRIAAEGLTEILKQPVVVENKGGAAGNLGAQIAAKAPADGYTWVYSATPMATNMRMYRKPGFDVLLKTTGAQALHVPYKGASESANAVLGKQVDFALTITSVSLPHIAGGKLVPLAVTAPTRNPRLPNVPTLAEAGVPGVTLVSFGGLSVPAGTPAPIVARISEALQKALANPEVRAKLEANGATVVASSAQEFARNLQSEIVLTEKLIKVAGIAAQ